MAKISHWRGGKDKLSGASAIPLKNGRFLIAFDGDEISAIAIDGVEVRSIIDFDDIRNEIESLSNNLYENCVEIPIITNDGYNLTTNTGEVLNIDTVLSDTEDYSSKILALATQIDRLSKRLDILEANQNILYD